MKKILIIALILVIGGGLIYAMTSKDKDSAEDGEIITMNIDSEQVDCIGEAPQKCMVINGEFFYDSIKGFEFESGNEYVLQVRRTERENVPADASKYLYELVEVTSKTQVGDSQTGSSLAPIYVYKWQWEESRFNGGDVTTPDDSSQFVLQFQNENRFNSTTDCNSIFGNFDLENGTEISFGQIGATKKACLGETLEREYVETLDEINTLLITGIDEGNPTLSLRHENGEMIFKGISQGSSAVTDAYCSDLKSRVTGSEDYVIMTEVAANSVITSGQVIAGCVYAPNGSYAGWAPFEGQVGSYELKASDGTSLATGPLSLGVQDWMEAATNNESLKYQTEITFDAGSYTNGELILKNENASGEPERDKSVTIQVTF